MTLPYTKRFIVRFGNGLATEEYTDIQFSDGWVSCFGSVSEGGPAYVIYPAHTVHSIRVYTVPVEPQEIRRTWDDLAQ